MVEENIHAAISMVNINLPVKLINLAEGALTGFTDEIFDLPHTLAARELFIDIPGDETEHLGRLAKSYETYIIAQCKARWPEVMSDRFFNTLFIIAPNGDLVHKAAKNHVWCRERSCTPHDVYDRWIEMFGDKLEAFYPVLRTERHRKYRHNLLQRRGISGGCSGTDLQWSGSRLPSKRSDAYDRRLLPRWWWLVGSKPGPCSV